MIAEYSNPAAPAVASTAYTVAVPIALIASNLFRTIASVFLSAPSSALIAVRTTTPSKLSTSLFIFGNVDALDILGKRVFQVSILFCCNLLYLGERTVNSRNPTNYKALDHQYIQIIREPGLWRIEAKSFQRPKVLPIRPPSHTSAAREICEVWRPYSKSTSSNSIIGLAYCTIRCDVSANLRLPQERGHSLEAA